MVGLSNGVKVGRFQVVSLESQKKVAYLLKRWKMEAVQIENRQLRKIGGVPILKGQIRCKILIIQNV
jgi:hypothetical protein